MKYFNVLLLSLFLTGCVAQYKVETTCPGCNNKVAYQVRIHHMNDGDEITFFDKSGDDITNHLICHHGTGRCQEHPGSSLGVVGGSK